MGLSGRGHRPLESSRSARRPASTPSRRCSRTCWQRRAGAMARIPGFPAAQHAAASVGPAAPGGKPSAARREHLAKCRSVPTRQPTARRRRPMPRLRRRMRPSRWRMPSSGADRSQAVSALPPAADSSRCREPPIGSGRSALGTPCRAAAMAGMPAATCRWRRRSPAARPAGARHWRRRARASGGAAAAAHAAWRPGPDAAVVPHCPADPRHRRLAISRPSGLRLVIAAWPWPRLCWSGSRPRGRRGHGPSRWSNAVRTACGRTGSCSDAQSDLSHERTIRFPPSASIWARRSPWSRGSTSAASRSPLVNAEGDRLTPSVVLFDGEDVVVGKEAIKAMATEADARGRVRQARHGPPRFHKVLEGKQYPPEVIEAWILNKLRIDATAADRPVQQGGHHRAGLLRRGPPQGHAGRRLHGRLRGAGHHQRADGRRRGLRLPAGLPRPTGEQPTSRSAILVYDLGGGTFDVTVMEIRGTRIHRPGHRRRRAAGRLRLGPAAGGPGGRELHPPALRRSARGPGHGRQAVAGVRRRQADALRPAQGPGALRLPRRLRPDRDRPASSSRRPRRTCWTARGSPRVQALKAAGWIGTDLDRVLLVGGSTRMPMVRDMLQQVSGKEPDASVAADEAVAHGAALHAGLLLAQREGQPPTFKIRNVNSHSLGVVGIDPQTRPQAQRHPHPPQHAACRSPPSGSSRPARPASDRSSCEIVEGESPSADDCTPDRPLLGPPSAARPAGAIAGRRSVSTTRPTAG